MFQSISGAPRVVEARRELEEAVDKLLLQNSGTNATSKNDETINNRTVTSKTTKKSATVSNNNSDKTRSGPVESTRAFKSVKENLSNFHSSLLIAVESAALELQSKANHTNNNNNSAAKGRTLNLDGGEEADANALATHTTTTDTTNDNINATAVSQEEIDLHTGGMVLPPSIRPSQQKAQKMPPDTIKKRTVSKKATSRSASSANKEKKTTTSGLGKEGGKTKNNNTTSEVRPTQSAPERTTGASPTSNQNSALSKLLLTLFYVQECNQCMAKLMKKGLYREAKLLFTEATTADISTLREISELLVEADYFTLPGKKVQPSSTENENDGKTKKKKSMSVASSKVSRGGNTPAPVAEDTTPDNNDAEPIDHEEKMWERMRMKTTNVVQEPITSASDLPLALWAHTLLVEHDNNRDVCLFQEAIQQDRFADVYTKIAVSEEEKKNNLNSDALAGRIEAMFQRICKTIAAPRFKASSTLHKIHAPMTDSNNHNNNNRTEEKTEVAHIPIADLICVREKCYAGVDFRDRNKTYAVGSAAYPAVYAGLLFIYEMSQVLLQRRVREEGGTSASSSESPAAEEEENDSEDNRVALCSYITHLLQRVLRVCEGEYVRSFLTLATTKYLPWRLQLYNSISQCYQQFGFTYEAYRTASLAYHKTRELIEIEYMDVILPPEEQQRVLETGLQKAILLKMQYTWEVMAADGTAGEANPAPLNNNESGAQHTFELLQRLPRDGSDLLSIVFHHLKKHAFLPKYSTANTEEVRKVRLYEDFPKLAMYICHNIIQSTRRPSRESGDGNNTASTMASPAKRKGANNAARRASLGLTLGSGTGNAVGEADCKRLRLCASEALELLFHVASRYELRENKEEFIRLSKQLFPSFSPTLQQHLVKVYNRTQQTTSAVGLEEEEEAAEESAGPKSPSPDAPLLLTKGAKERTKSNASMQSRTSTRGTAPKEDVVENVMENEEIMYYMQLRYLFPLISHTLTDTNTSSNKEKDGLVVKEENPLEGEVLFLVSTAELLYDGTSATVYVRAIGALLFVLLKLLERKNDGHHPCNLSNTFILAAMESIRLLQCVKYAVAIRNEYSWVTTQRNLQILNATIKKPSPTRSEDATTSGGRKSVAAARKESKMAARKASKANKKGSQVRAEEEEAAAANRVEISMEHFGVEEVFLFPSSSTNEEDDEVDALRQLLYTQSEYRRKMFEGEERNMKGPSIPFLLVSLYLPAAESLSALANLTGQCDTRVTASIPLLADTTALSYCSAAIFEDIMQRTSNFILAEATVCVEGRRVEHKTRELLGITSSSHTSGKLKNTSLPSGGGLTFADYVPLRRDNEGKGGEEEHAPTEEDVIFTDSPKRSPPLTDEEVDEEEETNYIRIAMCVVDSQLRCGTTDATALGNIALSLANPTVQKLSDQNESEMAKDNVSTGTKMAGLSTKQKAQALAERSKNTREKHLIRLLNRSRLTLALVKSALEKVSMRQDSLLDIYGTHSGTLIRPSAPLSFYRGKVRLWKTLCDLRTDLTRVLIVLRWRVALLRSQTQSYKQREEDIQTLLYRQLRTSTYGVATAKEDRILTTLMEEEPDIPSSATDEEGRLLQWSHSNPYLSAMVAMFLATVQEKRGAQKELLDSAMKTLSSIKQDGSESLALVAELEKTERDNKKVNFSFGNGDDTSKPKKKRETTALPKNSLEKEREREQHFYSLILLWSYAASSSGMLKVLSHATRARNYLYDHFIISKEQLLKEAEESEESHYSEALLAHPHKLILRQEALGKSSHTVLLMFCRALMDVSKVELEKVKSGSGGYVYPTPQVANSNRQNGAVLPETVQRISMDCAYRSLLALKVANHVYQQAQEGGGADTTGEENSSTALTSSSTTQAFASILECSLQIYEALHPSLTDTNYTPYVVEPLVALCYTLLELKESYSTVWSDPQIQLLAFNVIHSFRAVIHRMPPAWTATSGDANHEAVLVRQLLARTMVKAWNSVLANPTSRQVQYMAHTAHENHYVRRVLENGTSVPNNATNKSMPNYADEIARLENEKQNALLNRPSDDEEDAENAKAFPGDALVPEKENLPISDRMPIEFLELMEEMLFDVELNLFPLLLPHYVSAKPAANPTGKEKNSANNNNNVRLDPTRSQSYVKQLTDSTHSTKYKVKKFLGNDGVNGLPEVLVETAAVLLNAINSIRSTPATVTPASGKATTAGLPLEVLRQVEEAVSQYKEDPLCPKVAMRVVQVCLKQGYYTSAKSISQKALSIIDDQSGTLKRFAEEVHAELRKWLVKYNLVLSEGGAGGASARSSVAEGSIAADRKGSKKKKESAKASVVGKKGLKKEEDEEEVKETIEKQFVEPQRTWTAPEQQMLRQLTRNMSYLRRRIALRYQRRRFAQFCLPFQAQLRLFLAVATRLETEEKTKKEAAIAEKQMWALAASGDVHVTPIHETIVAESETNSVHPTSSKGRKALQTQQQQAEEAAAAQAEAGPINVQVLDACTRAATLYNYCLFPARAAHAVQSAVDDIRHYIAQHVPDPLLLFNLPALGATLGDSTRSNAEDGDAYGDGESPSKVNQINIDSTVQFSTKEIQEELKTVSPQIYALAVELLCALGHVLYGYCDHRQDIEFQQSAAIKVGRFINKNNPTAFAGYEPSLYVYVSPAGQHEERKHALRSRMEHRRQQRRNQRQLTECEEDEATTRDVVVMTHQSELYNLVQNYSEHIPELEDVLPVLRADMLAWHQEHALNENDGWGRTDRFNTKYQHKEDGGESELPDVVGRSQGDDLFATILTFPYPQAKSRKHTSTVSVALQEMILQQQYGKDIPEELMMHSLFFLIHCLQWSMPLKVASLCQNANALTSGRYALMLLPLERWAHQVVSTGVTPHMTHLERDLFTTLRDTPTGMKLLMFARHAWKRYTHTDAYKRSRRRVRLTAHRENTFLRKVTRHHSFNAEESAMSSVTANSGALIRQTLKGVVSLYQEAEAQLRERRELSLLGQCLLEMGYVYIQHNRRSEAEQSWLRALDSFLLVPQVLGRWCKKEFPLRCAKPERVVTREVLGGAFAHTVESELDTKAVNFSSLLLALNALGALSQYCYCDQQTRATDAAVLAGHLLQEYLTCSKAISYALPTRMCDFADINLRDLAAVLSPAWQPELREQLPHTAEQLLFLSHQLVEAGIDFHHAMLLASLSEYIAYHHVQQTEAVVNARLVRVRAAIAVGNTRAGLYLLQQICLGAGLPAPSLSHLSLSGGVVDRERHTIVSLVPPSGEAAVVFNSVSAAGRKLSKMEERRKSSQGAAAGNANSNKNDTSSVAWCVYNNSLPAVSEENLTALRSFLSLSLPNLSVEEVLKKGENEKERSGVAPVSLLHECIVSHYGYLLSMRVVLTVVEVLTSLSTQYALERWPTAATEVATSRPSSSKGATTATPSLAVAQSTTAEAAKVAEYIADLFLTSPSEEGGDTVAKKSTKPQASKTKGDKNNSNANATAQEGATVDEEELFYAVQRVEAHASLRHKVSLYKAYLLYAKGESESLLSIVADEIGAYNRLREVFSSEGEKEQGGGGSSLQSRGLSLITLPNVPTFLITLNHFHWCRLLECAAREYLQLRQYNALVLSSVEQVTALCSLCGDIYTPVSSLVLNIVALLLQGKTQKAVETFHLVERVIQSGALPVSVNPYAGWAASTAVLMEASGIAEIGSTGVKEDHSEDDEEEGKNGGVDRVLRLMYLYFRGLEFNSSFAYNSGVDVSFFDITKLFRFPKRGKPLIVKLSDQFNFDLTSVRHDMVIVPKRLPLSISRSSVYAVPLQNILNIITNRFIQRGFASPDDLEAFEQQKNNIWNSRFVLGNFMQHTNMLYDFKNHPTSFTRSKLTLARATIAYHSLSSTKPLGEEQFANVVEMLQEVVQEHIQGGIHHYGDVRTALLELSVLYVLHEEEEPAHRDAAVTSLLAACVVEDMARRVFTRTATYQDYSTDESMMTDWATLATRFPPQVLTLLQSSAAVTTGEGAASVAHLSAEAANAKTGKKTAARADSGGRRNSKTSATASELSVKGEEQNRFQNLPPVRLFEIVRTFAKLYHEHELYSLVAPADLQAEQEMGLRLVKRFLQEKSSALNCTYLCYPDELRHVILRTLNPQRVAPPSGSGKRSGGVAAGALQLALDNVEIWGSLVPPILLTSIPSDMFSASPAEVLGAPSVNSVAAASFTSTSLDTGHYNANSNWTHNAEDGTITLVLAVSPLQDFSMSCAPSIASAVDRKRLLKTIPAATGSGDKHGGGHPDASKSRVPSVDNAMADRLQELQTDSTSNASWRPVVFQFSCKTLRALHGEVCTALELLDQNEDESHVVAVPPNPGAEATARSAKGSRRSSSVVATLDPSSVPPLQCGEGPAQQNLSWALAEASLALQQRTGGPNSTTLAGGGGRKRSGSFAKSVPEQRPTTSLGGSSAGASNNYVLCDMEKKRREDRKLEEMEERNDINVQLDMKKADVIVHFLEALIRSTYTPEEQSREALSSEHWLDETVDRLSPHCAVDRGLLKFLQEWLYCGETEKENGEPTDNAESGVEEEVVLGATGKVKKIIKRRRQADAEKERLNGVLGRRNDVSSTDNTGGSSVSFFNPGIHEWMTRIVDYLEERKNVKKAKKNIK